MKYKMHHRARKVIKNYIIENIDFIPDSALKQLYDWIVKNKAS